MYRYQNPVALLHLANELLSEQRHLLEFPAKGYMRTLLHRTPQFELLALTWAAGSASPIHDHAGSRCSLQVVSGLLLADNFQVLDDGRLIRDETVVLHAGAFDHRSEMRDVHRMRTIESSTAISLHLYRGPIDSCGVYDESGSREVRALRCDAILDIGVGRRLRQRELAVDLR